jgi:hypothetical protein
MAAHRYQPAKTHWQRTAISPLPNWCGRPPTDRRGKRNRGGNRTDLKSNSGMALIAGGMPGCLLARRQIALSLGFHIVLAGFESLFHNDLPGRSFERFHLRLVMARAGNADRHASRNLSHIR